MNGLQLVTKEIRLRRTNFILSTLAVAVAVAVGLLALWQLRIHEHQTREYLAGQRTQLEEEMKKLEDDYRKITKELGYNLVLLPAKQDLAAYYAGHAMRMTMPQEYVTRLANTNLMTVQHLLPIVEQQTTWPEQGDQSIVLVGTQGEVSAATGNQHQKGPILPAVAKEHLVIGYRLAVDGDLQPNKRVMFRGREFTIAKALPERGTKEDVTVWAALDEAQELLGCPQQLHAMMALKCHCEGNDLAAIRASVAQVLPDVQVLEIADKSHARGRARDRAHAAAEAALAEEAQRRADLQLQRESLASWLIPAVWCSAAAIVGVLALLNVRERFSEIGVLRAFGLRAGQVLRLVLARGLLVGILGAGLGLFAALGACWLYDGAVPLQTIAVSPTARQEGLLLMAAAPILTMLVAWPPALLATQRDPAAVLGQE